MLLISQYSFAVGTKCEAESKAAALTFLIEDQLSNWSPMNGFGVQDAGASPQSEKTGNKTNVVSVLVTSSGLLSNRQILVDFSETNDNRCQTSNVRFDETPEQ